MTSALDRIRHKIKLKLEDMSARPSDDTPIFVSMRLEPKRRRITAVESVSRHASILSVDGIRYRFVGTTNDVLCKYIRRNGIEASEQLVGTILVPAKTHRGMPTYEFEQS